MSYQHFAVAGNSLHAGDMFVMINSPFDCLLNGCRVYSVTQKYIQRPRFSEASWAFNYSWISVFFLLLAFPQFEVAGGEGRKRGKHLFLFFDTWKFYGAVKTTFSHENFMLFIINFHDSSLPIKMKGVQIENLKPTVTSSYDKRRTEKILTKVNTRQEIKESWTRVIACCQLIQFLAQVSPPRLIKWIMTVRFLKVIIRANNHQGTNFNSFFPRRYQNVCNYL